MIDWSIPQRIVVLTGAGVSVASGLRPYRGPGGLWEEEDASLATVEAFFEDPRPIWKLFGGLRSQLCHAIPNEAHKALARLEASLSPRQSLLLVTQNVDGLHQDAGSQRVVELHGNARRTRCSRADCSLESYRDEESHLAQVPHCSVCGEPLRPDIVLFGEHVSADAEWAVKKALRDCDLFMAIGTSGSVAPASGYARGADYAGAHTFFVNLTKLEPPNPYFHTQLLGPAEVVLPQLVP